MVKFKKSVNKNGGNGVRGQVQIDIESNDFEALEKLESYIVDELGIEASPYYEETEYGHLISLFVQTREQDDFNFVYKIAKKKIKGLL